MANLDPVTAIKVSTNAAQHFVESYYPMLNNRRDVMASFYVSQATMDGNKQHLSISFNGNQISDAAAMQAMFEAQMPQSHYEVQCHDCHVVNPNYIADGAQAWPLESGKNMTILVSVSGYVKYGDAKEGKMRGFSETFLLVPNPTAAVSKQRTKNVQEWLIQTQNFRIVV
ncbi:MAG: hypothetical protein Q9174_004857 [Haloplaca sp. 1 TL-2023]